MKLGGEGEIRQCWRRRGCRERIDGGGVNTGVWGRGKLKGKRKTEIDKKATSWGKGERLTERFEDGVG